MTALSQDGSFDTLQPGELFRRCRRVVANVATYYQFGAIALDSAGLAVKATATSGLKVVGWYRDKSVTTVAGDEIEVQSGIIERKNSGTDPVTIADLENEVYLEDDQTIARTSNGGTLSPAGRLVLFTDSKPFVMMGAGSSGFGSASNAGYISIPLSSVREVSATGDVSNIAANGGVLASDTTPVYDAVATSNEHEILWATGNADPIGFSIALPRDFDDTAPAYLDLEVSSGTTDAATIVCASAWSAGAAGTEVSDSTSDTATKSATPHRITIVIAASDIPAGARRATFRLTPPTHATDTISLHAIGLAYKRLPLTA